MRTGSYIHLNCYHEISLQVICFFKIIQKIWCQNVEARESSNIDIPNAPFLCDWHLFFQGSAYMPVIS